MMGIFDRMRARVYELFEPKPDDGPLDKLVNITLMTLILLNVAAVVLDTVHVYRVHYHALFHAFEVVSVLIFSVEYLMRLWSCTSQPEFRHPVTGRLRFAFTALALVDLAAILPFYLPLILPIDLRMLRILRIFRTLRVIKIVRYSESMRVLGHVLRMKRDDLLVTVSSACLLLLVASSVVYAVENPAQPDKFPDIPSTIWWGVVTLTTVGYGDVYPITVLGKRLGGLIAFLGIGMFALPAGILGSGFVEEMQQHRRTETGCCPHCGRPLSKEEKREPSLSRE